MGKRPGALPRAGVLMMLSVLAAGPAAAESYSVRAGRIVEAETGDADRLRGWFVASPLDVQPIADSAPTTLSVDDFALRAGHRVFRPRKPIEYAGQTPVLFLEIANHVQVDPRTGDVVFAHLRSGGELVAVENDEVTFRFLEFRARGSAGRRARAHPGERGLPRHLRLRGTLHQVDQTFRIQECPVIVLPPPPPPPGGGGGGIIIGGSVFEIAPGEEVAFTPPSGGSVVISRVTGGSSQIDGGIVAAGSVSLVSPDRLVLTPGFPALNAPPTLEELGITAPDGAEATIDGQGGVTVTSHGDLFIAGGLIDIPGVTSLTIVSATSIVVEGPLSLPPGVGISLQAGDGTGGGPGGEIVVEPPPIDTLRCGLRPLFPTEERLVGSFWLFASKTRRGGFDARPWSSSPARGRGRSRR